MNWFFMYITVASSASLTTLVKIIKETENKVSVLSSRWLLLGGLLDTRRRVYRLLRLFMVKRLQKLPLFFVGVAVGASYA